MALPNSWTFKRTESHGIYFSDLEASLRNSVKFDVFANSEQLATLVTNNRKTFARTWGNFKLSLRTKSNWFNKWYYYLMDDSGAPVATIFVQKPFFQQTLYKITFNRANYTYLLSKRKHRESKEVDADFIFDLQMNSKTYCTIINSRKPPFLYIPTSVRLEGVIHFSDNLGILEILCFLQLVNIHIDHEFSP